MILSLSLLFLNSSFENSKEGGACLRFLKDEFHHDQWWGHVGDGIPLLGVYGKLGSEKGSFALLEMMENLKQKGQEAGLLCMSHGWPEVEQKFRARASELGLKGDVLQIPFLPHWRVPEFIRRCVAVCCFEQGFQHAEIKR